ncbi:MAG: tellurite resistance TerB C-terminal domain-containing protein, partial [Flavobacterium sp.]
MTTIIIIAIIFFIIYATTKKRKSNNKSTAASNTNVRQKIEQKMIDEFVPNTPKSIEINLNISSSNENNYDESIIDVTNQSYSIKSNSSLKRYINGIPYWKHYYVYSYSEIRSATTEQKEFYFYYKNSFLNGIYYDLEGNNNYSFILLFNLLNEFDSHKDVSELEKQLSALGKYYPKTKSYCISFLNQKKKLTTDNKVNSKSQNENNDNFYFASNPIDYDTFNWRSEYKTKLNLNNENAKLLDKIWYPSNNFCSIEFCCLEVIKLYIAVISELKAMYESKGETIEKEFSFVADIIIRKQFRYRNGSQNYKDSIESTTHEFYSIIFKHCENAVREFYGHKRKLNIDTYYTNEEAKSEFESKIISKVTELLSTLISKVARPDEATEIELNAQNTNRWKIKFEKLTSSYNGNLNFFIESIHSLVSLNEKNPSVENIFFEASKFIAKYDNVTALNFYVCYLYCDLESDAFNNKKLTKTIQKSLFKTNEQLLDFEKIISELIKDKDVDKALDGISNIYVVKRKKIQLDEASIKEVQQQHSGTVELLNEYLRDEFEDENNSIQSHEISSDEIKIEITQKKEESNQFGFLSELSLNPTHISVLELFSKNNFSMPQIEIEEFAKSKGVFKNQLIESINESCYEVLDDVLIEEEDDYYTIIP